MITINYHCDLCGAKIISACGTTIITDIVKKKAKEFYPTLSNPTPSTNETVSHLCDSCLDSLIDVAERRQNA